MSADYFDAAMRNRERLRWAVAARRQLERWEPLVAAYWRNSLAGRDADGALVWAAEIEHHFALVATHHLLVALDLPPASGVPVEPVLRAELTEGRHLHEHWVQNTPVFNVRPRVAQPGHKSGQDFAARNPDRGPYWWLGFDQGRGPLLMPHVPAPPLHRLLDAVEAEVLVSDPALSRFLLPRAPSPWLHEGTEWWPKPDEVDVD